MARLLPAIAASLSLEHMCGAVLEKWLADRHVPTAPREPASWQADVHPLGLSTARSVLVSCADFALRAPAEARSYYVPLPNDDNDNGAASGREQGDRAFVLFVA